MRISATLRFSVVFCLGLGCALAQEKLSYEERGDIYMARKMYREAIEMYQMAPGHTAVLANKIGLSYHQMLKLDLAKKNYERAVKLDGHYAEAINNLGTVYYGFGNYGKAIQFYKRALRAKPNTASMFSNMGAAYFSEKKYRLATEYYQRALLLDPTILDTHNRAGTLMLEHQMQDRATYYLYMAKLYAGLGEKNQTLIYLRKAMEEGIKKQKILGTPEFVSLKSDPRFQELLAENPKSL